MSGLAALLPFPFIALVLGLIIFLVVYRQQRGISEARRSGQ